MALQSINREPAGNGTVTIRRITDTLDKTFQETGTCILQDVLV
jgi:hypothetical protein